MTKAWMFFFVLFFSSIAEAKDFKLLTWNVYMLPKPVKFSNQQERTLAIVAQLKNLPHDVVILQEAFSKFFKGSVRDGLLETYPFQRTLGKSGRFFQVMSSGVTVLSRFPIREIGRAFYRQCASADCFASKGVLLVELSLPQGKVQLAMTHLQSGQKDNPAKIRRQQLKQVKDLLERHRLDGVPQILAGDLNIDALMGSEFQDTLRGLRMENSPLQGDLQSSKSELVGCLGLKKSSRKAWIDHVLMKSNGSPFLNVEKRIYPIRDFIDGKWCDLSDHLPVEAVFSF